MRFAVIFIPTYRSLGSLYEMGNIMSIGEDLRKSVISNALLDSLAQLNGMKVLLHCRQFARFGSAYGIKKSM